MDDFSPVSPVRALALHSQDETIGRLFSSPGRHVRPVKNSIAQRVVSPRSPCPRVPALRQNRASPSCGSSCRHTSCGKRKNDSVDRWPHVILTINSPAKAPSPYRRSWRLKPDLLLTQTRLARKIAEKINATRGVEKPDPLPPASDKREPFPPERDKRELFPLTNKPIPVPPEEPKPNGKTQSTTAETSRQKQQKKPKLIKDLFAGKKRESDPKRVPTPKTPTRQCQEPIMILDTPVPSGDVRELNLPEPLADARPEPCVTALRSAAELSIPSIPVEEPDEWDKRKADYRITAEAEPLLLDVTPLKASSECRAKPIDASPEVLCLSDTPMKSCDEANIIDSPDSKCNDDLLLKTPERVDAPGVVAIHSPLTPAVGSHSEMREDGLFSEVPREKRKVAETPAPYFFSEAPREKQVDETPVPCLFSEAPKEMQVDETPIPCLFHEAPRDKQVDETPAPCLFSEAPREKQVGETPSPCLFSEAPKKQVNETPAPSLFSEAPQKQVDETPAPCLFSEAPKQKIDEIVSETPVPCLFSEAPKKHDHDMASDMSISCLFSEPPKRCPNQVDAIPSETCLFSEPPKRLPDQQVDVLSPTPKRLPDQQVDSLFSEPPTRLPDQQVDGLSPTPNSLLLSSEAPKRVKKKIRKSGETRGKSFEPKKRLCLVASDFDASAPSDSSVPSKPSRLRKRKFSPGIQSEDKAVDEPIASVSKPSEQMVALSPGTRIAPVSKPGGQMVALSPGLYKRRKASGIIAQRPEERPYLRVEPICRNRNGYRRMGTEKLDRRRVRPTELTQDPISCFTQSPFKQKPFPFSSFQSRTDRSTGATIPVPPFQACLVPFESNLPLSDAQRESNLPLSDAQREDRFNSALVGVADPISSPHFTQSQRIVVLEEAIVPDAEKRNEESAVGSIASVSCFADGGRRFADPIASQSQVQAPDVVPMVPAHDQLVAQSSEGQNMIVPFSPQKNGIVPYGGSPVRFHPSQLHQYESTCNKLPSTPVDYVKPVVGNGRHDLFLQARREYFSDCVVMESKDMVKSSMRLRVASVATFPHALILTLHSSPPTRCIVHRKHLHYEHCLQAQEGDMVVFVPRKMGSVVLPLTIRLEHR